MFRPIQLFFSLLGLAMLAAVLATALFHFVPSTLRQTVPEPAIGLGAGVVAAFFGTLGRRSLGVLTAIGATLALFALSSPAVAADTTVSAGPVYAFIEPYIRAIADALIAGIIGWIALLIRNFTGIQIEARHREALHSAAMTGVAEALARLGVRLDGITVDLRSDVIAAAVEWIETSVPDAIAALGVTPDRVEAIATAKLGQLIVGASPSIVNIDNVVSAPNPALTAR